MEPDPDFWLEIAKLAISALTPISIYVAYKAYRANNEKQRDDRVRDADRELLAQAQKSLEWAYNSLTDSGSTIPPAASRLNWLTCARHLLRHRRIAVQIQSGIYKTIHAEHEEFWRHRFYLALDHNDLLSAAYFASPTENIELSSALVVVSFSNWPEDLKDPTDEVDRAALIRDKRALQSRSGRGLREYIDRLSNEREARKASP